MDKSYWRVELFGGLRAVYGNETIAHFRSRKTAALLAYLAFFRGPHPRDQLVEMLWPDFPLEAGRNSLRVALADLRRRSSLSDEHGLGISPPLLQLDYGTVGLCREVTTDITDFERAVDEARRALSQEVRVAAYERAQVLYTGPFLRGLYESWIPVEEARLEASYLYVLKALQGVYENSGDSTRAFELAQLAARFEQQEPEASENAKQRPVSKRRKQVTAIEESVASVPQQVAAVPAAFTRFFGREAELRELAGLLSKGNTRLLTILAGGGMGKTRLALELARRLERSSGATIEGEGFGRVLWVSLAETTEAERLPEDLIKNLNLTVNSSPSSGTKAELRDSIAQFLRGESNQQRTLLVLDNFEQLLPHGATFVGELLEYAPNLTVLATSRQRLNLTGERTHRVEGLALPQQTLLSPSSENHWDKEQLTILRESSSVQLFADRARGARADWRLCPREALTFIALLHRLEGVPLAIELVASRVGVLSLEQMLERLSKSLQWVKSRDSHRPTRHRSLHAVLQWSLELLARQDREIFARLSVFHGGWTLDDASAVLADVEPDALLESLQSLLDASLITSEDDGSGELRFSMLELVRQLANDHLDEKQRFEVRQRHAHFYYRLAERSTKQDKDLDKRSRWGSVEGSNLSAAIDFLGEHDIERALEMATALWWYWIFNYHLPEGRHDFGQLLANPQGERFPLARARAQRCAAYIALLSGYNDEAHDLLQAALVVWNREGDKNEQATLLNLLGASAVIRGEVEEARDFYAQSLALRRLVGPQHDLTIAVNALAGAERACGRFEETRRLCAEALERAQTYNDHAAESWAYNTLGIVEYDTENLAKAREYQEKSLSMRRKFGQLTGQGACLDSLGDIARKEGKVEMAREFYLEALQKWEKVKQVPKAQATQRRLDELEHQCT